MQAMKNIGNRWWVFGIFWLSLIVTILIESIKPGLVIRETIVIPLVFGSSFILVALAKGFLIIFSSEGDSCKTNAGK